MSASSRFSHLRKSVVSGIVFSVTVAACSAALAAYTAITGGKQAGDAIPSAEWNAVAGNLADHEAKLSNISVSSGNLGIWAATPGAKLEVGGQVKITGGSPGAGKVLTSDANGLASWQAPSVTGKILQVGYASKGDTWSAATTGDNFYTVPGLSVTLTPNSSSSKFLITTSLYAGVSTYQIKFRILRNGTPVILGTSEGGRPVTTGLIIPYDTTTGMQYQIGFLGGTHMDSPGSTSAVTYSIQMASYGGQTVYLNRNAAWQNNAAGGYDSAPVSTLTVMEVGN